MNTLWHIAGAGLIGSLIILGAAFAVPLTQNVSVMSTIEVEALPSLVAPLSVQRGAQDFSGNLRDARKVGPTIPPDSAKPLHLGQHQGV
jgi:hypothetical protein